MVELAANISNPLVCSDYNSGTLYLKNSQAKSRMTEQLVSVNSSRKQIRQPPSVPFLWEEKPGIPKKGWKPEVNAINTASPPPPPPPPPPLLLLPPPPPPVKLVASIPFTWEEKPGKPLPCFSPRPNDGSLLLYPPKNLVCCSSLSDADSKDYQDDGDDENDAMFESDLEAFDFETDDPFSSAPSLLANRLMSTVTISSAVPMQKTCLNEDSSNDQPESPSPASEADSSTSSYMTGTRSLVGSSFLECLFPLFPPNSGFLAKVGCHEDSPPPPPPPPPEPQTKELDRETNSSIIVRRAPTLGELILMSRRRSYRRKAVQMRKHNLLVEFTRKRAFGCCIFGTGGNRIGGLLGKGRQPRLKLV